MLYNSAPTGCGRAVRFCVSSLEIFGKMGAFMYTYGWGGRIWAMAAFVACGPTTAQGPCWAQKIEVTAVKAVKPGGAYAAGEKIAWRVSVTGDGASDVQKVTYVLKRGSLTEVGRGELELKENAAILETVMDAPGNLLAEFTATLPDGKKPIKNEAGALIAPDKIAPSAPRPADFDAFWKAGVKELKAVPVNPVLEAGVSGNDAVDYWKITLNNIRGSKIQGQLARPKAAKPGAKLPALLIVQWAGVYPLDKGWAVGHARDGWLTLNINAHDLPIDQPADFYKAQSDGPLNNYAAIGNEDKETSYFRRMYLSCYRAADYLASRPDWDGKTLVVMGTSQGGLQAIVTGGFHPKVTALLANVPAGCDQWGPLVGRQSGWPMWYYQVNGKNAEKVRETSRYYDVVNFARNVRCPALVALGLIDQTCPPSGVVAAFNQMRGPKKLVVMERSDHQGRENSQAPYNKRADEWLKRLAAGEAVPAPK